MASEYNILVIDDDLSVRQALQATLNRQEYDVRLAEDGEAGLEMAREVAPDLVLCDFAMPGIDGIEACKELAVICPDAVRILVTGHADLDVAMAAINEGGVYKFVRKPWNTKDLIVMVRRALEHSELVREGRVLMEMLEMAHRQQQVELQGLQDQVTRYRKMLGMG